jgi:uncharacterized membrane protein
MSDQQTTHTQPVADGYNVIAVSFEDDANAYNALTALKELDSQERVRVQEGVVVERTDDGQVTEKDRIESMFPAATAGGGLIGLLIGIIGGPLGMLIGGTTGLVYGSVFDLTDAEETDSALAGVSGAVKIGHTAVLAVVSEPNPEIIDAAMSRLGGSVARRPVAEVEAEIAAAEEAERKARHEARKQLIEARREKSKAAVDAKVDELKAKLPRRQKATV